METNSGSELDKNLCCKILSTLQFNIFTVAIIQ